MGDKPQIPFNDQLDEVFQKLKKMTPEQISRAFEEAAKTGILPEPPLSPHMPDMPHVVDFVSNGVNCKAFVGFGLRGLNMRSVQVNLGEAPVVNIFTLPSEEMKGRWRVQINTDPITPVEPSSMVDVATIDSTVWFDTDEASARAIKFLLEMGKAPGEE